MIIAIVIYSFIFAFAYSHALDMHLSDGHG